MDLTELLAFVVKNKASDLHLSSGLPPMIRVHGDVRRINVPPMEHKDVHAMIYDIMNDGQRKFYEENLECDFSFAVPNLARFRVNAFVQQRGARVLWLHREDDGRRLLARGIGCRADAHAVRRDALAGCGADFDHRDRACVVAAADQPADQRIRHVAAAEEGNGHAACLSVWRAPKIAVPTRTRVAPSAMASSRSSDMPMESVSTSNSRLILS